MKVVAAVLLLFALSLGAFASGPVLGKVYIPFPFTVSGQMFEPGIYQIRTIGHGLLRIESTVTRAGVAVQSLSSISESSGVMLVFHRYGSDYFLREINDPAVQFSASIPMTKLEHIAQQRARGTLVAVQLGK